MRRFLIFVLLTLCFIRVECEPDFKVKSIDDITMNSLAIDKILQTDDGFIWFSTKNGFFRYDSYGVTNFKLFSAERPFIDSEGNFWCVEDGSAFLFNTKDCRYLNVLEEYSKKTGKQYRVNKIRTMSNGFTWLLCDDNSCLKVNNKRPLEDIELIYKKKEPITTIFVDARQNTWLLSDHATYIYKVQGSKFKVQGSKFKAQSQGTRLTPLSPPLRGEAGRGLDGVSQITIKNNGVTDGCVWLLTDDGRLCYFDYATQKINTYKDFADMRFRKITSASSNTFFAVTDTHSYLLGKNGKVMGSFPTTETDAFYEEKGGRMWHFPGVKFYLEDKYGTIWAATNKGEMLYIDKKSGELKKSRNMPKFSSDMEFALKNYKQYFIDYQKNLWLLTDTKVFHVTFFRRAHERLVDDMAVRTMMKDNQQRIWIASRNEPVVRIYDKEMVDGSRFKVQSSRFKVQGSKFKVQGSTDKPSTINLQPSTFKYLSADGHLSAAPSRFNDLVCSMYQDKRGNIWIGTNSNGLFRLKETGNSSTISHFTTASTNGALASDRVLDMEEDKLGRLWIATDKGIHCATGIDGTNPKIVRLNEKADVSEDANQFHKLTMTTRGILFASTNAGLVIADAREKDLNKIKLHRHVREKTREESLSANTVMGVTELKNGQVVICTETGGLNLLTSKNWLSDKLDFRTFVSSTREPLNACRWALEHNDALYIFGSSLLTILTKDSSSSVIAQSHMKYAQLMFTEAKPIQIGKDKWLCGLYDGCISIDMSKLSAETIKPKFQLTMVQIGNGEPDYSYMNKNTIVLNSDERDLTVDFAALDYSGHYDAKYAINKGKNTDVWQFLGKNNRLSFVEMSPGEYHYFIRYTNANGIWANDEFELTIIVKPEFRETIWAQLLFVVLLALIIFLSIRHYNYIRKIKQQQKDTLNAYMELLNLHEEAQSKVVERETQSPPNVKVESQSDEMIKRVMTFIQQHLSDSDVSIDDMASAAAVSKSMLHVKIKEVLGVTPGKLISEARIKKACDMLADESLSITEIAFSCGFSDPKYFSRSFKKATGETPSDYRMKVIG